MNVKVQAISPIEATAENIKWVENYSKRIEWKSIIEYKYKTMRNKKGRHKHVFLSVIMPASELHPETNHEYKERNKYEL